MRKLELKETMPYLPYNLKISYDDQICELAGYDRGFHNLILYNKAWSSHQNEYGVQWVEFTEIKPILHPLSSLTTYQEIDSKWITPNVEIQWLWDDGFDYINHVLYGKLPYNKMIQLIEWRFDVFGLIDSGLAIANDSGILLQEDKERE